ncbi:MAG TPA: PEP-CTERM sorting domain-containing protein [Tepidisphaeraceae bacterium]|jgi:hypothetical protein|nr:PEP-CTERM sorting domain-containing protein [Tepidisphaeraceae bacterium]
MKMLNTFIAVAVLGSAASMASAALLVADGFNYTAPAALSGKTDVNFTSNPATWGLAGTAGQDPVVASGSLTYTGTGALPNLPGSSSAQVVVTGGAASRIPLGTPASAGTFTQAANAGTSLYYSFTMNVSDISKLSTGVNGAFIAGFNNTAGTATPTADAGVLCIRTDSQTGTTYHLGVAQQQATGRVFDATDSYSVGDTLFVVVAYNFGATAGTDTSDLYVFDGAAIPSSLPSTPTAHGAYTAEINTSVDNISSFFLRDNTGAATTLIDDVRIGTTWSDVATVPEPASLSLLGLGALGMLSRRRQQD